MGLSLASFHHRPRHWRIVSETFEVETEGGARVTAIHYAPSSGEILPTTLVLAHGAGAGQTSPFMVRAATGLSERGIAVVTFNFAYTEQRRRVPDRTPKLEACFRAVIAGVRARQDLREGLLCIGGKSLGGRIASHLAAAGDEISRGLSGLVCLGYPLHPPGQPTKLRTAHLAQIRIPILIVQGSRDAFGTPDELRSAFPRPDLVELFVVDGGDHSFKVSKKPALQEPVDALILDQVSKWIRQRAIRSS